MVISSAICCSLSKSYLGWLELWLLIFFFACFKSRPEHLSSWVTHCLLIVIVLNWFASWCQMFLLHENATHVETIYGQYSFCKKYSYLYMFYQIMFVYKYIYVWWLICVHNDPFLLDFLCTILNSHLCTPKWILLS